ncbi:MAG: glycosyltransferase family 4 protein [Deltaproteobacteria bacterium]|nr:glycosyltransferase family 4 protein [Deltaproteobacteria bacterium]
MTGTSSSVSATILSKIFRPLFPTAASTSTNPSVPPPGNSGGAAFSPITSAGKKADIVHFILDGALVPKTVASVFTFFDIARTHPAYRRSVASSPLRAAVRTWMRHRAVRRADVVVTTSETAKRDIAAGLQIDPSRIAVAPIAPARIFTPGTSDPTVLDRCGVGRRPYLLFVGQFGRQKNEDALLEALRGVPETCLVLVGDPGDLADATKKRCADEALAGRVFFAGRVTDDDLCSLYRGATALCLPSHYEGYGLPAVEAMACGTPVVVSDGGALPEIVGAAGIVAPLSNRHALRDALLAVTRDAAIRERLRAAGLERAREFGHDAMAERHREIYRHALAR